MTPIDRWLQRLRIAKARLHIAAGTRVLDVGSGDGALFRALPGHIGESIGIAPDVESCDGAGYRFLRGRFPCDLPDGATFGAITMSAVLEHVPIDDRRDVGRRT